jgi:hypothetical protein
MQIIASAASTFDQCAAGDLTNHGYGRPPTKENNMQARMGYTLAALVAALMFPPTREGNEAALDRPARVKTGHRTARTRSQQKKRIRARQQGHAKRRGCRL